MSMKSLHPKTFSDYAAFVIIGFFAAVGLITAWDDVVVLQVLVAVWLLLMLLWAVVHVINMMIQDETSRR